METNLDMEFAIVAARENYLARGDMNAPAHVSFVSSALGVDADTARAVIEVERDMLDTALNGDLAAMDAAQRNLYIACLNAGRVSSSPIDTHARLTAARVYLAQATGSF